MYLIISTPKFQLNSSIVEPYYKNGCTVNHGYLQCKTIEDDFFDMKLYVSLIFEVMLRHR